MRFKVFLKNIYSKLYAYLLVILASILIACYSVELVAKPRNEKTISFFIVSDSYDISSFEKAMWNKAPDYLLEMVTYVYTRESENIDYLYSIFGYNLSDIIIIPNSMIKDDIVKQSYSILSEDVLMTQFSCFERYCINDFCYGLKIHKNGEDDNSLLTYSTDKNKDEDYFAFFKKNSIHNGVLSNSNFNTSFELIQAFNNENI